MTKEAFHPMHDIDASTPKMRPSGTAMEPMQPRGTSPGFEAINIEPIAVETSTPGLLEQMKNMQPVMRDQSDKDRFAGILNALRGSFV